MPSRNNSNFNTRKQGSRKASFVSLWLSFQWKNIRIKNWVYTFNWAISHVPTLGIKQIKYLAMWLISFPHHCICLGCGIRIWKGLRGFWGFTWGGDSQGEDVSSGISRDLGLTRLPAALRIKRRWSVSHSNDWSEVHAVSGGAWVLSPNLGNSPCDVASQPSNSPCPDESLSTVDNHRPILVCPDVLASFQSHRGFVDRAMERWQWGHRVRYLGDPGEAAGFLEFGFLCWFPYWASVQTAVLKRLGNQTSSKNKNICLLFISVWG